MSAATSPSGGRGGSTRTPGKRSSVASEEPDGHLDLCGRAGRADDVLEVAATAGCGLVDRSRGAAVARLDLDLLQRWAVEDEDRRPSKPEAAKQLDADRLADGDHGVGASERPAWSQGEPAPEPRRIRVEAAVELVGVVDEPGPVATRKEPARRERVEVVRVHDLA